MKKRYLRILLICAILCLGAGLVWKLGGWGKGGRGTFLQPCGDYPAGAVIPYCQRDEAWEDDKLGDSIYTMGSSGCLTCCIASALSTRQEASGTGWAIDAGKLNQIFGEKGVYNESGDIVWGRICEALPETEVIVASSVDAGQVEELLAGGRYPIVKVKAGGKGAAHWVLLVGSENGEYLCMDPLNEDGRPVPFSRHGGTAYRMRCVYWADGNMGQ